MLSNFACSLLLESTEVSAVPAEVVDAVTNYSSCSVPVVFLHVSVRLWRPLRLATSGQLHSAITVMMLLTFITIHLCTFRLRHPAGIGELWP